MVVNSRSVFALYLVREQVEYVKQEAKIVYLLECLQKTAPPVCIFCEKKQVCPSARVRVVVRMCVRLSSSIDRVKRLFNHMTSV